MTTLKEIENEINTVKERNVRVEADKAWELSWTRKVIVALVTYFVITLFFIVMNIPNPFVNSLIPTLGFILSTLSLPLFKDFWMKYIYKK